MWVAQTPLVENRGKMACIKGSDLKGCCQVKFGLWLPRKWNNIPMTVAEVSLAI